MKDSRDTRAQPPTEQGEGSTAFPFHAVMHADMFPVGLIVFNDSGLLCGVNSAALQLLGRTRKALLGMPVPIVLEPACTATFLEHLKRCRAGEEMHVVSEIMLRREGGSGTLVEIVSVATVHEGARGFATALIDLTARKESERALAEAKQFAENFFEFVPEPLLVLDNKLCVKAANSAFRDAFRAQTSELHGCFLGELECVRFDTPDLIPSLTRVVTEYEDVQEMLVEATLPVSGKRLTICLHARRFIARRGEPPLILVAMEDITARQRNERERENLLEQLQHLNSTLEERVSTRTAELRQANRELLILSRRVLEAQETERHQLARELHDEVGQSLTGLMLVLGLASRGTKNRAIAEAREIVATLLQRVRNLSVNLRPHVLDNLGLLPALRWHIDTFSRQSRLRVKLDADALGERTVPPEAAITVFRVVQEALTNVARHAKAKRVAVRLGAENRELLLEVWDDGCGFDLNEVKPSSSGLRNMRERAELSGGRFSLESAPGKGSTLRMRLPLNGS